jgi:cyclopropane fatty-acyl-phospholipid synthase-like methyltransferase
MNFDMDSAKTFYDKSYAKEGFSAQRRYPNEELCRFIGRHFHHMDLEKKKNLRVLETGCGSGANLWMLAKEGFDTYGLDLSNESLKLAEKMLSSYGVAAHLKMGDMTRLDYPDGFFDVVVDIFSSYCLTASMGRAYIREVRRTLREGGIFFSYFPEKSSDAFKNHDPAILLDENTLNGIHRETSPFFGNFYPFRFMTPEEYESLLESHGFSITYCEVITKTYRKKNEAFSFVTIEGQK